MSVKGATISELPSVSRSQEEEVNVLRREEMSSVRQEGKHASAKLLSKA